MRDVEESSVLATINANLSAAILEFAIPCNSVKTTPIMRQLNAVSESFVNLTINAIWVGASTDNAQTDEGVLQPLATC
jgi:hypothetical protein